MRDSTCLAPGCSQPVTDAFLCSGCVDLARERLRDIAGHPSSPTEGPSRLKARAPGRWRDEDRDGALSPDSDTPYDPTTGTGQLVARDGGLLADLEILMSRQDVAEPDTSRPIELDADDEPRIKDQPIAAHPLPVHLRAGKVLGEVATDLRTWTAALVEQRHGRELEAMRRQVRYREVGCRSHRPVARCEVVGRPAGPWVAAQFQLPDASRPRELALWLERHLHDLRQHPDAGAIVAGLARHKRRAQDAVTGTVREYLGLCSECWVEREREVDLYCDRGDDTVTCPRCGSTYGVPELRAWLLEKIADERLRAADMSRALVDHVRQVRSDLGVAEYPTKQGRPLTESAIRNMADRGRLVRYRRTQAELDSGVDPAPLYRVGEVMALVEAMAREDLEKMKKRAGRRSA